MVMNSFQTLWHSCFQKIGAVGIAIGTLGAITHQRVEAQVVPAQDSIQTQVVQENNRFDILGGTIADNDTRLFHSFEQFDLEPGYSAQFHIAPGIDSVFGRITNGLASHINGLIEVSGAPASLYLMNPAGILFGTEASINLAGDFTVLTTDRLDFEQGHFALAGPLDRGQGNILQLDFNPDRPGTIVNLGDLQVGEQQSLSLLGHTVVNQGTLSGGAAVNVVAVGAHSNVQLSPGIQFSVQAEQTLLRPVATDTGHAAALEVAEDGTLMLTGSSLPATGTAVVGGSVTAAEHIRILGDHVAITGAKLQAAGQILIGGDYQGAGTIPTAQSTFVDAASYIVADGERGGQVVIWSDGITQFHGSIRAQGLLAGGTVEVSGKEQLYFGGQVDLRSHAAPGTLLLDPENLDIRAGSDPNIADTSDAHVLYEDTLESAIIGPVDLVLQADNDITIAPLSDGALTFAQGPGSSIRFLADADGDGAGRFTMAADNRLAAPGQNIAIQAAEIAVGDITTSVFSAIDNTDNAGNIRLTATQGSISGGRFTTTARGTLNNSGDGGAVALSATDTITVDDIRTTTAGLSNNGDAGAITLATQTGTITAGTLKTTTSGNNNTGIAGEISLTAASDLLIGDIVTAAEAITNNAGDAGAITLTSLTGDLTTGSIIANTRADSSNVGNAGTVSLNAIAGEILSQTITATAVSPDAAATRGGDIQLTADGGIVIDSANASGERTGGDIDIATQQTLRIVETVPATDQPTSLLTTEGGEIRLTYNQPTIPFSMGDSTVHGIAGNITTGIDTLAAPQTVIQTRNLETIEINNLFEPQAILPAAVQLSGSVSPEENSLVEPSLPDISFLDGLSNRHSTAPNDDGDYENTISNSELIWAQIETSFSSDFAKALNLSMPAAPSLQTTQQTLRQVTQAQDITPALMYIRLKETHIELVLVSGEGPPVYHPVPVSASEVHAVAKAFHQTITNPVLRPAQYLPAAQQLFDWLMRPMLADLEDAGIDHIGFILDAGLRSLPIAALHDGQHFLIEDYSIGLLPSAGLTDFDTAQTRPSDQATLAMGIADFEHHPDLAAVPLEIDLASQHQNDEQYLDQEATLGLLHQRLEQGQFTSVHLATHAVFEPGNLAESYIQLWDQTISLNQLQTLPLDSIEFLILSACATAFGDPRAEFGFAGLAVNVGVQTALASLWSISDEGTLGLMSEFYSALEQPLTRSAALRQAQLAMHQGHVRIVDGMLYGNEDRIVGHLPDLATSGSWDFSHPAYWSGFTLIGHPW